MFTFKIQGAHYAVVGEKYVNYYVDVIDLPAGVDPAGVKITWYKNGVIMPLYPWEDQMDWYLQDVGYPAAGEYYAIAEVDGFVARSNTIELEIGAHYREIKLTVNSRTRVEAEIGDIVTFVPECLVQPDFILRDCVWTKGGVQLGEDEFISVPINSDDDYGVYNLHTTAYSRSGYIPINQVNPLEIVKPGTYDGVCPFIYLHDLNGISLGGGRNKGYIWMGWWVIDEVMAAVKDQFNWVEDPYNGRFRYQCEIARMAEGFKKYGDLEVQESRHGYILNKHDLGIY